jgi:hypothetical protein
MVYCLFCKIRRRRARTAAPYWAAGSSREKERNLLRLARTDVHRHEVSQHLFAFHDWCAASGQPGLHRLATTIEQWWPHIEAFLHTRITNAVSANRIGDTYPSTGPFTASSVPLRRIWS